MSGTGTPAPGASAGTPSPADAGSSTPAPAAVIPAAVSPGAGGAPAGEVAASTPTPAPAETPAPVKKDWRDDRIRVLTAKLAEAKATGPAGETPPASSGTPPPAGGAAPGSAEFNRAVEIAAAQRAEIDSFNNMCNQIASDGKARFGEPFLERVNDLLKLVDKNDQQSLMTYNAMLMAASESGDAAATVMELGSDLNEASRILAMSPIKMAAELTRKTLARKAIDPTASTVLPKPITPVGRAGQQHTEIDPADPARAKDLPSAEWHKRREQQVDARRREKLGLPPLQAQA